MTSFGRRKLQELSLFTSRYRKELTQIGVVSGAVYAYLKGQQSLAATVLDIGRRAEPMYLGWHKLKTSPYERGLLYDIFGEANYSNRKNADRYVLDDAHHFKYGDLEVLTADYSTKNIWTNRPITVSELVQITAGSQYALELEGLEINLKPYQHIVDVVKPGRVVCLNGVPGTGKTVLAKQLMRPFAGHVVVDRILTIENLEIYQNAGFTHLFIDEFDRHLDGEFTGHLRQLETWKRAGLTVVLTTNNFTTLPAALSRPGRVDHVFTLTANASVSETILGPLMVPEAAHWPAAYCELYKNLVESGVSQDLAVVETTCRVGEDIEKAKAEEARRLERIGSEGPSKVQLSVNLNDVPRGR